jgi:hypothetical protein
VEGERFLGTARRAGRQEKLTDFLNVDTEINREQRIILIAEAYDYEVLVGAEWLHNAYELDILCCRIALSIDPTNGIEYLACTPVFPAPELAVQAVPRRRSVTQNIPWPDWDHALADLSNPIAEYYKAQLTAGRESRLRSRELMYRIGGKRRWFLSARENRAYCWQVGRFKGDIEFWTKRLSNPDSAKPVQRGIALRFFVSTAEDFAAFHKAATQELIGVDWTEEPDELAMAEEEADPASRPGE